MNEKFNRQALQDVLILDAKFYDTETYPTCSACRQPEEPLRGCKASHVLIDGVKYQRIKAGDEVLYAGADTSDDVTCSCNVGMGQYHHWDCDVEECPACHEEIDECGCSVELDSLP